MTIQFVRRSAAQILKRGQSAIRVKQEAYAEAAKALTKDDVRSLIKNGSVYAIEKKHNLSINSKILRKKRSEGRRRGRGRRKGTSKARGSMTWEKKVRSQRFMLREIKAMDKLDNALYRKYYLLVKGAAFADKASLLLHLSDDGIKISKEELSTISKKAKARYKK